MGYDAYIEFKNKNDKKKVITILEMLKYKKIEKDIYMYYETEDYKSLCGNSCDFYYEKNRLMMHFRTFIHCCDYDLFYINHTIKTIKGLFDVSFFTDYGKNRYFKHNKFVIKGEAGVYKALFDIENDFENMKLYIDIMKRTPIIANNQQLKENFPEIFSQEFLFSTMGLPYLCSIIEDFFRNTFIALFKYSENKEKILNKIRYNNYDIERVLQEKISLEEAIARGTSFQNIKKIIDNFSYIDSKMDIKSCLLKPYRKRKESLYQALNRILEQRHNFIHSKIVTFKYDLNELKRDVELVEVALKRVYKYIVNYYNWEDFS